MVRLGAAVIAMEVAALTVAYLAFGWPVLLIGALLLVGTVLVLAVVRASEAPRRRLQEHRATRWDPTAAVPGGLMSGFFEMPAPHRPVQHRPVQHRPVQHHPGQHHPVQQHLSGQQHLPGQQHHPEQRHHSVRPLPVQHHPVQQRPAPPGPVRHAPVHTGPAQNHSGPDRSAQHRSPGTPLRPPVER